MSRLTTVASGPLTGLWPLAGRLAWREGRRGVLRGFVLALALAVASLLCVVLVADRLQQAIGSNSREFLAGDRVIESGTEIPARDWRDLPAGIAVSQTVGFSTMLFSGEQMQLASVRAIGAGYPWYGQLRLTPQRTPQVGEIWLSARLMALLQTRVGKSVELGNRQLTVAGVLDQAPDEGFSPFQLAPRALMHLDDLAAAGVILPGSRVEYRYQLRVPLSLQATLDASWPSRLQAGQKWLTPQQQGSAGSKALERSERFFRLAALIGVLLGALAMQIALQHFTSRQADQIALLKTLGASRRQLWCWMLTLLALLCGVAVLVGGAAGYLLHLLFVSSLGPLLPPDLPPPSWQPLLFAIGVTLFLTLLLALVPFSRLLGTPPLRVLRQDLDGRLPGWITWPFMLLGIGVLSWQFTGDGLLSLALLGGMLVLLIVLGAVAYAALWLLPRGRPGTGRALALAHLRRSRRQSLAQLSAIALAMLLLGLLWSSRAAILAEFDHRLSADVPNRFVINIAEADRQSLQQWLQAHGIAHSGLYPVVRGRLLSIGGEPVAQAEGEPGRPGVYRELTMTWLARQPAHNQVIAGEWWSAQGKGQVSVEQGVAERLGIRLGDRLRFNVEGREITARVSSLRKVNWEELQPNFFMIFSPDVLANYPASWLASMRVPPGDTQLEHSLVRAYPTLTLIDTDNIMQRLKQVLGQISQALGLMFALVAIAAVLVLFTQVQSAIAKRWHELVLMRTLGAATRQLNAMLYWEWLTSGALAGVAAAACCELIMLLVQPLWSELAWQPQPLLWISLPLLGMVLVLLAARSPMMTLLQAVLAGRLREVD